MPESKIVANEVMQEDFPAPVYEFIHFCGINTEHVTLAEFVGVARILFLAMRNVRSDEVTDQELEAQCYPPNVERLFGYKLCFALSEDDVSKLHDILRDSLQAKTKTPDLFDLNMALFGLAYVWLKRSNNLLCDPEGLQMRIRYFRDLNWEHPFIPELENE